MDFLSRGGWLCWRGKVGRDVAMIVAAYCANNAAIDRFVGCIHIGVAFRGGLLLWIRLADLW